MFVLLREEQRNKGGVRGVNEMRENYLSEAIFGWQSNILPGKCHIINSSVFLTSFYEPSCTRISFLSGRPSVRLRVAVPLLLLLRRRRRRFSRGHRTLLGHPWTRKNRKETRRYLCKTDHGRTTPLHVVSWCIRYLQSFVRRVALCIAQGHRDSRAVTQTTAECSA